MLKELPYIMTNSTDTDEISGRRIGKRPETGLSIRLEVEKANRRLGKDWTGMAREMYLVGVDETELEPPKAPEPPKGFKAKWENFWYHYKWPVIIGALAVIIVVALCVQAMRKEKPDYYLIIASTKNLSVSAGDAFAEELEKYGRDLNEDGQVIVTVELLYVGNGNGQLGALDQQKLTATVFAGDTMFFGFSPDFYQDRILENMANAESVFFDELGIEAEGVSEDGRTWTWREDPILQTDALKGAPEDLIFGVRAASGTAGGKQSQQMHDDCLELLRAYIAKSPLEPSA